MSLKLRTDGFLERGGEVTRMEAFVDAAFAFALTMLVISVDSIPDSMPKLLEALKGTPAFAASFAQIAGFWYQHMTWSRRYGLDDRPSIVLSLVLVFLVMVYIYPLKAVFATFFGWITHGALPYGFEIHSIHDLSMMFVVYGLVFGTMGSVIALLYLQAWRQRVALALSLDEQVLTAQHVAHALMQPAVALVSITLALSLPLQSSPWMYGMPGMAYALLSFSGSIPAAIGRRVRARLTAAAG
ncbi:hypothetical protein BH11PSE14_BH11PSE14_18730 [soil metagenome]